MTPEDDKNPDRRASVAQTLEAYRQHENGRGTLSSAAARAVANKTGSSTCGQCGDIVTFHHNGATYAIDEDSFPVRLPMDRQKLESIYARVQAYKEAQRTNETDVTPALVMPT